MRSWATCIATSARARCMGCCACAALRRTMRTSSARRSRLRDEVVACIEFARERAEDVRLRGVQGRAFDVGPEGPEELRGLGRELGAWRSTSLKQCAGRARGFRIKTIPGEAAFYGPKIDIKLVDVLGRLWQLSTVQFDFNLPARFELEYKGEDGEMHQPVMVHRALFGIGRAILRRADRALRRGVSAVAGAGAGGAGADLARSTWSMRAQVKAKLEAAGLRVELDARNEKMNAKIRDFATAEGAVRPGDGRQGSGVARR